MVTSRVFMTLTPKGKIVPDGQTLTRTPRAYLMIVAIGNELLSKCGASPTPGQRSQLPYTVTYDLGRNTRLTRAQASAHNIQCLNRAHRHPLDPGPSSQIVSWRCRLSSLRGRHPLFRVA